MNSNDCFIGMGGHTIVRLFIHPSKCAEIMEIIRLELNSKACSEIVFFQSYSLLIARKLYFKQKIDLLGYLQPSSLLKISQQSVGGLNVSDEVHGPFDFKRLHENRSYKRHASIKCYSRKPPETMEWHFSSQNQYKSTLMLIIISREKISIKFEN